jgi:hypothetical protein
MSRARAGLLAAVSTLASIATAEVHGVLLGVLAAAAALSAGAAAVSASDTVKKKYLSIC